jgi:hypothetical protein
MITEQGNNKFLNYLSGNRCVFTIPDLTSTSFTINGFELPSITLPAAPQATPLIRVPVYGETLTYQELTLDFLVMENLENWLEFHTWIRSLGFPEESKEFKNRKFDKIDGYATIYSSHNNPIIRFKFLNLVPIQLGGILFTEAIQETTAVVSSITMEYERYDVEIIT